MARNDEGKIMKLTNKLIKEAILRALIEEYDSIPPVEELEKMYTFSERHNKRMQAIFDELRKDSD